VSSSHGLRCRVHIRQVLSWIASRNTCRAAASRACQLPSHHLSRVSLSPSLQLPHQNFKNSCSMRPYAAQTATKRRSSPARHHQSGLCKALKRSSGSPDPLPALALDFTSASRWLQRVQALPVTCKSSTRTMTDGQMISLKQLEQRMNESTPHPIEKRRLDFAIPSSGTGRSTAGLRTVFLEDQGVAEPMEPWRSVESCCSTPSSMVIEKWHTSRHGSINWCGDGLVSVTSKTRRGFQWRA